LLPAVVSQLYHCLALGGRILIRLSPLYYSANGAQLAQYGLGPWEHLLLPHAEVRARVFDTRHCQEDKRSAAWTCYENLNRIGAADISKLFCESGFHQVRYYETRLNIPTPRVLHESFFEDTLTREQVVFMFAKA
jgi:hypothetical protein